MSRGVAVIPAHQQAHPSKKEHPFKKGFWFHTGRKAAGIGDSFEHGEIFFYNLF
jgi:hypothetical protein